MFFVFFFLPADNQLTPCHLCIPAYSDNPDRDSLDGNLPSSSHGTNPPPAPPMGALTTTNVGFTKGPNAKKKHKKLKADDDKEKDKDKKTKRKDTEGGGDSGWDETEPW